MTKSRGINAPRIAWTDEQLAVLRRDYPHVRTTEIATALGLPLQSVYAKAGRLGLLKSEAFAASDKSGRIFKGGTLGQATQFVKGQASWSKGTKGRVGVQEACRATQFKPGRLAHESHNYLPLGTVRLNRDGHLERKVTDDPSIAPARRWVPVYRLVWEAANGPIPPGGVICFKPGQRTVVLEEITVDRLELVSRADLARRNTPHGNWPPELARVVQLRGALTRQINKRAKETP